MTKENKELVPFYAFRDGDKYKDDIFVCINGKSMRIKRGVNVMIPKNVYDVLMQSMDQDAATAMMIEENERLANGYEVGGYI